MIFTRVCGSVPRRGLQHVRARDKAPSVRPRREILRGTPRTHRRRRSRPEPSVRRASATAFGLKWLASGVPRRGRQTHAFQNKKSKRAVLGDRPRVRVSAGPGLPSLAALPRARVFCVCASRACACVGLRVRGFVRAACQRPLPSSAPSARARVCVCVCLCVGGALEAWPGSGHCCR